jgi:hypothetical protein
MQGRRWIGLAVAFVAYLVTSSPARAAGWSHDPTRNLPLVLGPRGQCVMALAPDMKGGAVMVWADPCTLITSSAQPRLLLAFHATHVLRRGDVDPAWPSPANVLINTSDIGASVLPDSLGGAYLAWPDIRNVPTTGRDLYVHHLKSNGSLDPAWPAGGLLICNAIKNQNSPLLASDGHGGLIAAWSDRRDSATTGSDIYAAHVRSNGTLDPAWPANGAVVCNALKTQSMNAIIPDGQGGAILGWTDFRIGSDVYAMRVRADGTVDPAWPANGVAVAATADAEDFCSMVGDGAGGAFVAWHDEFAQIAAITHVLPTGVVDPAWPAGGLIADDTAISAFDFELEPDGRGGVIFAYDDYNSTTYNQNEILIRDLRANGTSDPQWPAQPVRLIPSASNKSFGSFFSNHVSDGHGGAIYAFFDDLDGTGNQLVLSAMHVSTNGVVDPDWPAHGRVWSAPPSRPDGYFAMSDGSKGMILAWSDLRDSLASYWDIYAERVTDDGFLGIREPEITAVRDVPNDQGGHATVYWYASAYDTLPADPVTDYDVWRELDTVPANAASRVRPASAATHARPGDLRLTRSAAKDVFWEFLGSVAPRGQLNYAFTVPTRADSSPAGIARETYEVDAHVTSLNLIASSDPDSGYSVDNLAPATPSSFAGSYSGGSSTLHWDRNLEPDFATYRLYRGPANFTPGPSNLVATLTGLDYTDNTGTPYEYKLSATDLHGNVSGYALAIPAGALDASAALPRELGLAQPSPSPAGTRVRLGFALPHPAPVALSIYDVAGRRVRDLMRGPHQPGAFVSSWDLRDDGGHRVAPGLYIITLESEGRRLERRVVTLH